MPTTAKAVEIEAPSGGNLHSAVPGKAPTTLLPPSIHRPEPGVRAVSPAKLLLYGTDVAGRSRAGERRDAGCPSGNASLGTAE